VLALMLALAVSADPPRLLAADRERELRALVPPGVPFKPDTFFYDERSVPRMYQVFDGRSAAGFIHARRGDGDFTANNEFPWADPAGTVEAAPVVRFASLPGPVLWWRDRYRDGTFAGFSWEYAAGSLFGEVLLQVDSAGEPHAWEVRTRTKRDDGGWNVQAYRPYPTEADLAAALRAMGVDYDPPPARRLRLDSGHARDAFAAEGWTVTLPDLRERDVARLLDRATFTPALGQPWRVDGDRVVEAPTSAQDFGLVPRGYAGWAVPVDRRSCMRCHVDAGRVVNAVGERRWRLRGGDGIWSFHPFDPATFTEGRVQLNRALRDAGLVGHKGGEL